MSGKAARQRGADEAARAAVAVVAAHRDGHLPSELTLSNGIVLSLKPTPPGIIERAMARLERPKPPRVMIEAKGVEEENPSDPDYLTALEVYEGRINETATNTLLLVGTAVKTIPDDLYGPEDQWFDSELMTHLGVEADMETRFDRYLSWLRLYALANQEDILNVISVISRLAGIGEEDVQAAVAGFRGRTARGADRDLPAEAA